MTFDWNPSNTGICAGISGYRLEISIGSGDNFDSGRQWIKYTDGTTTQATQSISPNGTYYRKVYAMDDVNGYENEKVSEEWMFTMNSQEISCTIRDEALNGEPCTA